MHVCACLCSCGVPGIQYYVYILFLRFYAFIFLDVIKHDVLTLVGVILHYRYYCYYYYSNVSKESKMSQTTDGNFQYVNNLIIIMLYVVCSLIM